jgi:hypothetical protein
LTRRDETDVNPRWARYEYPGKPPASLTSLSPPVQVRYRVVEAASGEEGLEKAREHLPARSR